MDAPLPPPGARLAEVLARRDGQAVRQADALAEELPVALVFNGITHAVMLATPTDLADFALGFGLTEGLLAQAGELYGVDEVRVDHGIELRLQVASACEWRLKERRRTLAGRTGCGLCGTDSLAQVRQVLPVLPAVALQPAALGRAQRDLRQWQRLQQSTGATHAAAWCAADGTVGVVREDVGRHNALDKLVGALQRGPQALSAAAVAQGFVCITSRASFEMVQKTARAGVSALAAVSAPTALAVDTAWACGLLLAGFVRGDDLVAYSFSERLGLPALPPPTPSVAAACAATGQP
ncbi:formate dehydrogenase accessory sulfurtransferase FdhD [Aquabacterium sp. OR-4]|uniref:formate dehydrogenase accessory sulfurtransferase FdhD n=1 Tax=Aquabacterium sp. OR-4 TaxID=2978127 RepID=UPI0021B33959|nr:formate dehydrogenase accessory sulfurtransferase FdhD [Aquabacterium sp. OR-4]MDT7838535.1 formate dehydrogenase accessory sulfurtransferase FdhD [Aquabacterium sp. OR-4]